MDFHYDLNSWSHMYREEALRKARKRHLAEQARGSRKPVFCRLGNAGSILNGILSVLKW